MKNFLLTCLCSLIVAFSFGQDKAKNSTSDLKRQSVVVVEYINKNIKLDPKQKTIVMNAFSEYAANIKRALEKTSEKTSKDKSLDLIQKMKADASASKNKKKIHEYMLRFSTKRDKMVKECLKKKQLKQYNDIVKNIHPFTLEVRPRKKK